MSALFSLPKTLSVPGAKLTFTQTLTTTPQNVYTDSALTIAHANPVVADSSGVFEPIYLDPSLPNYRVKLTTSADVLIYQVDDVPSNQGGGQSIRLTSTQPTLILEETDAGTNAKKYRISANSGVFAIDLLSDDEGTVTNAITLSRTGNVLDYIRANGERLIAAPPTQTDTVDASTIFKRKTGDTSRTNNTSTIDPDLQYTFPTSPGAFYMFEAFLAFTCGSTTPGTSFQVAMGGSKVCRYTGNGSSDGATVLPVVDPINFSTTSNATLGWAWTNTAAHFVRLSGHVLAPAAADVLAVYWSQTTTNATAMVLKTGSYLRLTRVS